MKVAVIGSRNPDVQIEKYIPKGATAIISGGARGIDSLAELYADNHGIEKIIFRPEYEKYGKNAPLMRNRLIIDTADIVIAVWDGKSCGTKFGMDYARKVGKYLQVFIV